MFVDVSSFLLAVDELIERFRRDPCVPPCSLRRVVYISERLFTRLVLSRLTIEVVDS